MWGCLNIREGVSINKNFKGIDRQRMEESFGEVGDGDWSTGVGFVMGTKKVFEDREGGCWRCVDLGMCVNVSRKVGQRFFLNGFYLGGDGIE